jgi:hypothetical protein
MIPMAGCWSDPILNLAGWRGNAVAMTVLMRIIPRIALTLALLFALGGSALPIARRSRTRPESWPF